MVIRSSALAAALCAAAVLAMPGAARAAPPSLTGPSDLGSAYVQVAGADVLFQAINTGTTPVGRVLASLSNPAGLWSDFDGVASCQLDLNGDVPPGGICTLKLRALPFGVGAHSGDVLQVTFD